MSVNKAIAKDSLRTTVAIFFVQATAFFVSAIVAWLYGANLRTDAYFLALSIPALFTAALFGALKAVFIPVFTTYKAKTPEEEKLILGSMYFSIFSLSMIVFILMFTLAPLYVPFLASGFDSEGKELAVNLTRELLPLVVLTSMVGVFGSVYNAYQKFIIPIVAPVFRTFVLISVVLYTKQAFGIHSLAIGTVTGDLVHLLILVGALRWEGIYFGLKATVHSALQQMARLSFTQSRGNEII